MSAPGLGRRLALAALKAAAFILVVLALSEASLRFLTHRRERNRPTMESLRTSTMIMHRLWGQWLDKGPAHPFKPPFTVLANRDFDDPKRMEAAYALSRLQPGKTWTVPDFLQSPESAQEHLFTITSNALGFRDPPRTAAKPPRTYRVLCLGAYQTFGLGVDDEQAYPRVMERLLNAGAAGGMRFEVWNGGLPSATAILGLARMQREVFEYRPDIILLDYGFVDAITLDDNLMPVALRLPSKNTPSALMKRALGKVLSSPLARSYLINKALQRAMHLHRRESLRGWEEAMTRMIRLARSKGVPVFLLDQGWVLAPESDFERLASIEEGVQFIGVRRLFQQFPPSEEQVRLFHERYNWTREFEPFPRGLRREYVYQVDIFHPNAWGHEVIARAVAERVRRIAYPPRRAKPA